MTLWKMEKKEKAVLLFNAFEDSKVRDVEESANDEKEIIFERNV